MPPCCVKWAVVIVVDLWPNHALISKWRRWHVARQMESAPPPSPCPALAYPTLSHPILSHTHSTNMRATKLVDREENNWRGRESYKKRHHLAGRKHQNSYFLVKPPKFSNYISVVKFWEWNPKKWIRVNHIVLFNYKWEKILQYFPRVSQQIIYTNK